jgi:hypothetical protein
VLLEAKLGGADSESNLGGSSAMKSIDEKYEAEYL